MAKNIILLVSFLICISFVSASVDFNFSLIGDDFGVGQTFDGIINISHGGTISGDEILTGGITSCGSYSEKNITLYSLLNNSELVEGPEFNYEQSGSPQSVINHSFSSDEHLIGFLVEGTVSKFEFNLAGTGGPFKFDIGNDGVDYQYVNGISGWSSIMYSESLSGYDINNADEQNPKSAPIVEIIEVVPDEVNDNIFVNVNIKAKADSSTPSGELSARIGTASCIFDTPSTSWTDLSCNMTIPSVSNVEIRIIATTHDYRLPAFPDSNFNYIGLQVGEYNYDLSSTPTLINDTSFLQDINFYRASNCISGESCVVPFNLMMDGAGTAELSDLTLIYGGTTTHNFYAVNVVSNSFDVNEFNIPLSAFSNLIVPNRIGDECRLTLEFMDEDDYEYFNVSAVPNAIITSNLYSASGIAIQFDGSESNSENKTITSWSWDFGDDSAIVQGVKVSHIYTEEGDYIVTLNVTDSAGHKDSTSVVVHIISLEAHLASELPSAISQVESLFNYFPGLSNSDINHTYNIFNFNSVINSSKVSLNNLYSNFTSVQDSALTDSVKNTKYSGFATELDEILKNTPKLINVGGKSAYTSIPLTALSDVFQYSGMSSIPSNEVNYYLSSLYSFNQNNVDVSMDARLVNVTYLLGKSNFMLVEKSVTVSGGSSNVLVEDLRNYDISKVEMLTPGGNVDTNVIFWPISGGLLSVNYLIHDLVSVSEIKSVVHSGISYDVPDLVWNESCDDEDCLFDWCGDGRCNAGYETESSCPRDCSPGAPLSLYVYLGLFLLIGILYLNFYKGPGNFRDLSNKLTVSLFHKRLFTNDSDLKQLTNYVADVIRQGYKKEQIHAALLKRGWSDKQIDFAFKNR
jgi:PKD repeat protein